MVSYNLQYIYKCQIGKFFLSVSLIWTAGKSQDPMSELMVGELIKVLFQELIKIG